MRGNVSRMWRSGIALLLALCMVVGLCPVAAFATEHENGQHSELLTSESLMLAWNWLLDYAQTNYPEAYEVCFQAAEYLDNPEFEALCLRLQELYKSLNAATTPEQREKIAEEIYKLITRLQKITAMATAKKLENVDYYVSLGDSTLTGYGLDKYVPGLNNGEGQILGDEAPVLLAQKLFGEDYTSHFRKLDQGGLRVDDLLVWLGEEEFVDDFYLGYTMDNTSYTTEMKQELFIEEVQKADLITLALGGGNITTFLSRQVVQLREGKPTFEMDWTRYFPEADLDEVYAHIKTLEQMLEGKLPEVMGVPAEQLVPVVAESFLFGLIGYIHNYPRVLERIHEINPDAHLVIVGYFNSVDNMVIPVTIEGHTIDIPAGTMLGVLMESCNAGSLAYALAHKENTTFVSIPETTTLLDEQGKFDLASQLNGMIVETWLTHAGPEGHKYIADRIYTAVTNEYTNEELAWALLQIYLEELGIMDAVQEGFQATLDKLNELIGKTGGEVAAELNTMIAEMEALAVELVSIIEDLTVQLDALEKELAEKSAQLSNAVGEVKEALEVAVAELEKKIAEIKTAIAEINAAMEQLNEALDQLNNVMDVLIAEGVYAAIEYIQATLGDVAKALERLVGAVSGKASAKLNEKIESVKAQLNDVYFNVLCGEYTITENSHYVALGDSTAVSNSYVDNLAEDLTAAVAQILGTDYSFTNLAKDGLMIQDVLEILAENAEEIAKADLVTIGFGSNGFTNFMVENLMNQINGETVEFDWVTYVGEDGVAYVEDMKADLYDSLVESGISGELMGMNLTDLLMLAVESYAYSFVAYTCSLPELVDAVHELSPDALVVLVGMYNPLTDVAIELGEEGLEIGKYLQYLVEAVNAEALAVAMLTDGVVYVDAPAVETNNNKTEMTVLQFISEFMYNKAATLNPNENGHAYITEQILGALIITEEQKGLLGDVNGDGVVNHNDARLVLQYYVGVAKDLDLTVADVDGNGVINHNDARLILQFYVGIITVFPVEA